MVKAYLRYELSKSWGVITSNSNVCYTTDGSYLVTAALEEVCVWNTKQSTVVQRLCAPPSQSGRPVAEVTRLAVSPAGSIVAAGHADGAIRLWSLERGTLETTFVGHRSAISALAFSPDGATLASGSRDTEIVLWDVGAESGLFRLRGHTADVTALAFLSPAANALASSSKDGLIKVWDLDAQRCFQTVSGAAGEVWALAVDAEATRLASAGSDDLVCWYRVRAGDERRATTDPLLEPLGDVVRRAPDRASELQFLPGDRGLLCTSAGRVVDVFRRRTAAEAARHAKRRLKRVEQKKTGKKGAEEEKAADGAPESPRPASAPLAIDELEPLGGVRSKHKIRSVAARPAPGLEQGSARQVELAVALANNSVELWSAPLEKARPGAGEGEDDEVAKRVAVIEGPGHRADVRALGLTSDDGLAISASSSAVKVWNPRTAACLRTIEGAGYGTALLVAPGDRHAALGTKEGAIVLIDVAAGEIVERVEAHSATIWSLAALPDGSGFVSGSGDKEVKEWTWTLTPAGEEGGMPRIGIAHRRTLQMTDDVLAVRVSPNGRLLAVALLDATVRVFFLDSFKFFLSLYGHKLPVLSMDITSDSTLIITGSADKNLKIWGLDFGDCHRSLFAHDDSVMAVACVPKTHYVFTAGKDGTVKYWDADKFEHLLTLQAHHAPIWALAVSGLGDWVLTAGADRSLRRWDRTDEPFFIDEERERRLESLFEADLEANDRRAPLLLGERGGEPDPDAAASAAKKSLESVSAADAIIEALDTAAIEEAAIRDAAERGDKIPEPNPLLLGLSPAEHVLAAVRSVRGPDLESAALLLPFNDALRLLGYAVEWLRGPVRGGAGVELLARLVGLILRVHLSQLSTTPSARATLHALRDLLHERLDAARETFGFNLAGMATLQGLLKEQALLPAGTGLLSGHKRPLLEVLEDSGRD